ncbi:hypothetical protein V496_08044 [Pseudogymnoascus sp. VKM F-4515 (FW-2607)]|nr:hypothetical protein V496_08044 [Pseudogymnoascus sp. VKM F-4515 (FW-2607)]KFY81774.1 hypothetical protein V498_08696 [Pseudogymnoascus sp. VKM F-4517 (FW-2822)]
MPIKTIETIIQQDIPRNILPPAYEFDKAEALATLKAFGFITKRHGGASYDIHRSVLSHARKIRRGRGAAAADAAAQRDCAQEGPPNHARHRDEPRNIS